MLRSSENPPVRTPAFASVGEIEGEWWVGHTKARAEKMFVKELAVREIPYFLPLVPRVSFSGGRRRRAMVPLFTSYAFFAGDAAARAEALATGRLCQAFPAKDRPSFVRELVDLERAVEADVPIDLHPWAVVGKRVRVRAGRLEGVTGVVINRDDVSHLVIQIGLLGQGAAVPVDADLLEPAD